VHIYILASRNYKHVHTLSIMPAFKIQTDNFDQKQHWNLQSKVKKHINNTLEVCFSSLI